MTQSEYETLCRKNKTEERFYTEKEIANKCSYLCKKYDTPFKVYPSTWFDGQLKIAEMIGIYWMDLYNKGLNIENLFKAYSIEQKQENGVAL